MNTLVRAGALSLVLAATVATTAALAQVAAPAADTLFRATTLNLSAFGEARAVPDMATINLGVNTEAPTAAGAMATNSVQMNKIFAALRRAGIADKDIQTTGLNLSAQYDYVQNEPPKLRGYQASNQVTVAVRDLSRVGAALDATVTAGANQVNGISFGLADPAAAENQAREAAVKALNDKANLYARATGYRVGRLVTLSEGGGYTPVSPMPMMAMARMDKAESTPIAAGEMRVRVDVSAMFELTR